MTTTLTILAISVFLVAVVLAQDWLIRRHRRNDRDVVRRLQRYLDQLPPARPW